MLRNRLLHDLRTRPAAAALVVVAVALAGSIGGVGAGLVVQLVASTGALFDEGRAPDLVQMHAGAIDAHEIEAFAATRPEVSASSLRELLALDPADVRLTPDTSETGTTIEYLAVAQGDAMDLLLDANGGVAAVEPDGIGIPVDLASDRGIGLGDTVTIGSDADARAFTVTALIRDAIMNSSLASSRRLLVAEADLEAMRGVSTGSEWLIEFALVDRAASPLVYDAYLAADLPANGPQVDRATFELMAGLTDGLVAAAVLLIAALLTLVAALILSLTVRAAIAAELRQIGVLRAIGLPGPRLRRLVLGTHGALLAVGAALGAIAAVIAAPYASEQIRLRLGGEVSPWTIAAALVVAALAFAAGLLLARAAIAPALRRPPLEVMRAVTPARRTAPHTGGTGRAAWAALARAELVRAPADHLAVLGILLAVTIMTALPVSVSATLRSGEFLASTGIAVSDVRIDLRADERSADRLAAVEAAIAADPQIARAAVLSAVRVPALGADGEWSGLNIESGDHTAFPLSYRDGAPPTGPDQLALSELNAEAFDVGVGDTVVLRVDGTDVPYRVVGVYLDVTNGGRTAKAVLPDAVGDPLWDVVLADVVAGADIAPLVERYAALAAPARVTDVAGARADLLGPLDRTVANLALGTVVAGAVLVAILTALVLHLLLVRGARRQAVMQTIGAPLASLRAATLAQVLGPAGVGVALGATLGPLLAGGLLSTAVALFGASRIPLDPAPLVTAIGIPMLLIANVAAVSWWGLRRVPPSTVARTVAGQDG